MGHDDDEADIREPGRDEVPRMTLLRQIQQELASSDIDVVAVLRKCKILARRLHSDQFAQWVDCELNGYPKDADVPEYRTVHAVHDASSSNGYYIRPDPQNADRRRKGYTAVAAKVARVVYAVVTTGTESWAGPCVTMVSV